MCVVTWKFLPKVSPLFSLAFSFTNAQQKNKCGNREIQYLKKGKSLFIFKYMSFQSVSKSKSVDKFVYLRPWNSSVSNRLWIGPWKHIVSGLAASHKLWKFGILEEICTIPNNRWYYSLEKHWLWFGRRKSQTRIPFVEKRRRSLTQLLHPNNCSGIMPERQFKRSPFTFVLSQTIN